MWTDEQSKHVSDEVLEDGVARDSQAETETKAEVVETKMPGVRNSRKLWNQLFHSFPRAAQNDGIG